MTRKSSEKFQMLTVLPKSWSIKKIQQEFKNSDCKVTSEKIKQFYIADGISRIMPRTNIFLFTHKQEVSS
jgi:hypothetical protein